MKTLKNQDDIKAVMNEIKDVWDLLAYVFQLALSHVWKIIILVIVIGIVMTGLSIKYKDFEIKKDPIEVREK